jgi:phosphate:Na+ symporter
MTMLAELLAGLGLLFVGLRLIGHHLRQAAGHRVRNALRMATASRWSALFAGALTGAVTQSSNAVTLITANLVHARVLALGQAIPVVAGANAGTAVLVFLATLDMRLAVLYLMAMVGLSLHFKLDNHPVRRDWLWAALGLALLFMGLDLVKHAPSGLSPDDWRLLLGNGLSDWAALLVGLAVAVITQSSSAATILAVATLHGGFISFDAAFWIMTGANVGSGIAVLLSGSGLKGSGRQLCLVHVVVKVVGTAVVAAAWIGVQSLGGAAASAALAHAAANPATLLAVLFLAMQVAGALPVTVLRDRVLVLTAKITPADPVEQASMPHYIYDRAVEDPVNALNLAELERDRLTVALPALVPDLDQRDADSPAGRRALWAGHRSVASQTSGFVAALLAEGLARPDLNRALHEQLTLENLQALQDTLHEFGAIVDAMPQVAPLVFNLSEALRTLTTLLADAAQHASDDPHDLDTLIELTGDRGDLLERLRRQLMSTGGHDEAQIQQLLGATRLFERAVWLMRRVAIARRGAAPQAADASRTAAYDAAPLEAVRD